jgi:hypothetical protein
VRVELRLILVRVRVAVEGILAFLKPFFFADGR